jgi:hypothetical protein
LGTVRSCSKRSLKCKLSLPRTPPAWKHCAYDPENCRLPGRQSALLILKPETVIAWHRKGFRLYWTWKSRPRHGRPSVSTELRDLIRRMSLANPRWGAPRIHGELLKLGLEVSQATVAKYMVRHRKPSSQTWRTFLKNRMTSMVSADFFVVPTITFRLLFVFVILSHDLGVRFILQ